MPDTRSISGNGIGPGTRDIIPWFGSARFPGYLCLAMVAGRHAAAVTGFAIVAGLSIGPALPASFHAWRVRGR